MPGLMQCASCGVCIGPAYDQEEPEWAGGEPLCSFCKGKMEGKGYIQVTEIQRLLPDGSRVWKKDYNRQKGGHYHGALKS